MDIPVLIEPIAGNGFRARGCEPLALVAEGATREEALQKVREQLQERLQAGAQIVPLDVPSQENPWVKFAGMFKDDPYFAEVIDIMAEERRLVDEDPNYL
jgi:predicted RNase H-like HicB family nuclease